MPRIVLIATIVLSVGAVARGQAASAASPAVPKRVSGRIEADQRWSGVIWIIDDLVIVGAEVTVAAGTTVEFAGAAGRPGPVLRVGGIGAGELGTGGGGTGGRGAADDVAARGGARPAALRMIGEPRQPIRMRTHEGCPPGRIELNLAGSGDVEWRHVEFEGLGVPSATGSAARRGAIQPALIAASRDGTGAVRLASCVFRRCAHLTFDVAAPRRVEFLDNRILDGVEPLALSANASAGAALVVRANLVNGGVRIESSAAEIVGNAVIGEHASLTVGGTAGASIEVRENYVHNTATRDDGRYAASFEQADAVVEGNVFRGGTYAVLRGARRMSDNAMIAAARLESRLAPVSRTHHLVSELPARARFTRNILIGPAFSMVSTTGPSSARGGSERIDDVLIDHCTFDGRGATGRAVHLNRGGTAEPVNATVTNNAFIDVTAGILDEAPHRASLRRADRNAYVRCGGLPPPKSATGTQPSAAGGKAAQMPRPFHPPPGAGDLQIADPVQLSLAGWPNAVSEAWDAELLGGPMQPRDVIAAIFRAYLPGPSSPLLGRKGADAAASAPADAESAIIGAVTP